MDRLLTLALDLVRGSKLAVLGGSHLLMRRLFIIILINNLVGILPYTLRTRSHLVYTIRFALPFWSGLVISRVILGYGVVSIAKLVLRGLPLLVAGFLCWFELLSIFLR